QAADAAQAFGSACGTVGCATGVTNCCTADGRISCSTDADCDRGFVAFTTPECAEAGTVTAGCPAGGTDLDGDGDAADRVLQAYDLVAHRLVNSGQEVIPCAFEACDPRAPYRVLGGTVKFLTYECAQGGTNYNGCPSGGTDLNGDGDAGDLVIQILDVNSRETLTVGTVVSPPPFTPVPTGDPLGDQGNGSQVAAAPAGRCVPSPVVACDPTGSNPCGSGASCD